MKRGDLRFIFISFILISSVFLVYANDVLLSEHTSPRIGKVLPEKYKFTNGSNFAVKYTEENLNKIILNIDHKNITRNDCESGRNKICNFNADLSAYESQILTYYFFIEDNSGNRIYSKLTPVIVDTIKPIITDVNSFVNGKRITLIVTFEENNLNKIEYMDNQDSIPKWKNFCSHGSGGKCEKRITFKGDDGPDLSIRITDKAGNSFERLV